MGAFQEVREENVSEGYRQLRQLLHLYGFIS